MIERKREKLTVVFRIDAYQRSDEVNDDKNLFDRVIVGNHLEDIQALQKIVEIMRQLQLKMVFNDAGKEISVEEYLKAVKQKGRWSRTVESGGLSFRFGRVLSLNHSFLIVEEISAGSVISWLKWAEPFLLEKSFVQAWVSDVEYDYWQNAKDPLEYKAGRREYVHLRTKSNGLPPPLEQTEIDISENPGRWSLQPGYIEAVSSTMWLGELFFESVGKNRKDALFSADWLDVRAITDNVTQVVSSACCFHDTSTTGIQNNLRAILYG